MTDFNWKVASNGYAWAEDYRDGRVARGGRPVSSGRLLVPKDLLADVEGVDGAGFHADDRRVAFQATDPFRETGLFRDFAGTPLTEPMIRAFADQHGTLGADGAEIWPPVRGAKRSENEHEGHEQIHRSVAIAQSFDHWCAAITTMKSAVELLDRLPRDRKGPIAKKLQEQIQDRLEVTGVVARFQLDPLPFRQPALHLAPINLHGVMWLQLARAASGTNDFKQCLQCSRWFELSPDVTRKSRLYCSERCRTHAYRRRKAKARELRASGSTLRKIADELDSDEATVRGWLGE